MAAWKLIADQGLSRSEPYQHGLLYSMPCTGWLLPVRGHAAETCWNNPIQPIPNLSCWDVSGERPLDQDPTTRLAVHGAMFINSFARLSRRPGQCVIQHQWLECEPRGGASATTNIHKPVDVRWFPCFDVFQDHEHSRVGLEISLISFA